ncbi:MAG: hypothetical protein AAGE01_22735 [Pseudomonadota bacterium]
MKTHEIQGYVLVLNQVVHITRVFTAPEEGFQFNIGLTSGTLIKLKYPDRATAVLKRDLLIEAINDAP